jgi:hypothetical protein
MNISISMWHLLTIVFIVLKLCGVITWSWWLVLSPSIFTVTLYLTIMILWIIGTICERNIK